MKTAPIVGIVVIVLLIIGGWYWWSQSTAAPLGALGISGSPDQGTLGESDTGVPQPPQGDGTGVGENLILGVSSNDPTLGTYLTAYNGMTVYRYTEDATNVSNCSGACAQNWPPYTVPSVESVHVPVNITGAVDTITRADGTLQVTYKGSPLYFWKNDTKPGDTTGQNVGGIWFVVNP